MSAPELIQSLLDGLVTHATDVLIPIMSVLFVLAILMRGLIYYTLRRNEWFVREFDKRVDRHLLEEPKGSFSFFITVKKLLEKTYYELFEVRAIMKRRKPDFIMPLSDRVFLLKQGVAWLVKDSLRQIQYLKHKEHPKLLHVSKNVFRRNPCFNKVFGYIPAAEANDVLNILPGTFIVAGIFGTFLGIMKALPELGGINLADVEQSKAVMDQFLLKTAFAMSTSLVGIIFSVCTNFFNTTFNPQKVYLRSVDRFESALELLWNRSNNNDLPETIANFDENRDPIEALAEQSMNDILVKKGSSEASSGKSKKAF